MRQLSILLNARNCGDCYRKIRVVENSAPYLKGLQPNEQVWAGNMDSGSSTYDVALNDTYKG